MPFNPSDREETSISHPSRAVCVRDVSWHSKVEFEQVFPYEKKLNRPKLPGTRFDERRLVKWPWWERRHAS
jgi:hypothetical protein